MGEMKNINEMTRKELVDYVVRNKITFPNRGPMANKPIPSNTMKNKAWLIDRIETVNQEAKVESNQKEFEEKILIDALNYALRRVDDDRVLELQRSGASNDELKDFVGNRFGIWSGSTFDYFNEDDKLVFGYVQLKGGKNPKLTFTYDDRNKGDTKSSGKKVELKGAKLLRMIRQNVVSEVNLDAEENGIIRTSRVSIDRDNAEKWLAHDWIPDSTESIFMFKELPEKVQNKLIKTAMDNTYQLSETESPRFEDKRERESYREDMIADEVSRYEIDGKLALISETAYEEFFGDLIKLKPKEFKETATDPKSITDFSDILGYMNRIYNTGIEEFFDDESNYKSGIGLPVWEGSDAFWGDEERRLSGVYIDEDDLGKGLREANDRARLRKTTLSYQEELAQLEKIIRTGRLKKVRGISQPVKNDDYMDSFWVEQFTKNMPVEEANEIREILLQNEELGSNVIWGNVQFTTNMNTPLRTDQKTDISNYEFQKMLSQYRTNPEKPSAFEKRWGLDKSGELKDLYAFTFYDPVKDINKKASTSFSKSGFAFSRTYKDKNGRKRRYVSRNAGNGLIIWNDPTVARKIAKVGRSNGWLVRTIPVKGGYVNIANKPKIDEIMDKVEGWGGNLTKGEGSGSLFEKKNSKPAGPYYRKKYPACVDNASRKSGLSKEVHQESFKRGYGAAITNPASVRNRTTGKKRPGGWPKSQRMTPTQWGCARTKKLGRLKDRANFDQDLIRGD